MAAAPTASSPAPSASPSPAAASAQPTPSSPYDPCVIGTWRETLAQSFITIDGRKTQFSGSSGATQKFRTDGTVLIDYGAGATRGATIDGDRWEVVLQGSATMSFQTSNGTLLYSNAVNNGSWTLKVNGQVNNRGPLQISLEPERYTCSGDSLREFGGSYSIELTRTSSDT